MSDNGNTQACVDDTRPCVKGCGFYGSAQTGYMCSKCFKDTAGVTRASIESPAADTTITGPPTPPTLAKTLSTTVDDSSSSSTTTTTTTTTTTAAIPPPTSSISSEGPDAHLKESGTVAMEEDLLTSSSTSTLTSTTTTTPTPLTQSAGQKKKTRCAVCNKKVGLTGIECRCEMVFCGVHRYPSQHNCGFDHKEHDRANLKQTLTGGGQFAKMADQL